MRQRFTDENTLKCTALKKNPTSSQLPDVARSTGIFPRSIFPVDPEQIQAFLLQRMTSTTFAPSRILLADLLQRFLIFSLPCQKDCWDWQRSGELSRQRRASAAEFLNGPRLLLSPLIAQQCKQVENKQLLLEEAVSRPKLFGKENPFRPPCFPNRKQAEEL